MIPHKLFPEKNKSIKDRYGKKFIHTDHIKNNIHILRDIVDKTNMFLKPQLMTIEIFHPEIQKKNIRKLKNFIENEQNCWQNIYTKIRYPMDDFKNWHKHSALILKIQNKIFSYLTFDVYENEYNGFWKPSITFMHFNISCGITPGLVSPMINVLLMYILRTRDISYLSGDFKERIIQKYENNMLYTYQNFFINEYGFKVNDFVNYIPELLDDTIYITIKGFGNKELANKNYYPCSVYDTIWYNKLEKFYGYFSIDWAKSIYD